MAQVTAQKIAIVRVRGTVGVREDIANTLRRLKLTKPNHVVIYELDDVIKGMLDKVHDFVTWGEVDEETLKLLDEKAAKEADNLYRLAPPLKGYGRKGIKQPFTKGGALGYRGEKINDLIKRMIH